MTMNHGLTGYHKMRCRCEICRSAERMSSRKWHHANREKARAKWRQRSRESGDKRENREGRKARRLIFTELRAGRLTRPNTCEECGTDPGKGYAGQSLIFVHIPDYSDPWTHEWLCSSCSGRRREKASA